jgi:hypothetical protein
MSYQLHVPAALSPGKKTQYTVDMRLDISYICRYVVARRELLPSHDLK